MNNNWSLREEIDSFIQQWYILFVALLTGALLGWGAGAILPAEYEAVATLYIAFNGDAIYLTPDDYKNWQMGELEAFVLSDRVLSDVSDELGSQPSEALQLSPAELRERMALRWQNAGQWELAVRDQDPEAAAQIAESWKTSTLKLVGEAFAHARAFYSLDLQLKALLENQQQMTSDVQEIEAAEKQLSNWQAGTDLDGTALEDHTMADLAATASQISNLKSTRVADVLPFPPVGETRQVYQDWTDTVVRALRAEKSALMEKDQELRVQIADLEENWLVEREASFGLSAFLFVESLEESPIQALPLRSSGLLALLGAILGGLVWFGFRLVKALRKRGSG